MFNCLDFKTKEMQFKLVTKTSVLFIKTLIGMKYNVFLIYEVLKFNLKYFNLNRTFYLFLLSIFSSLNLNFQIFFTVQCFTRLLDKRDRQMKFFLFK